MSSDQIEQPSTLKDAALAYLTSLSNAKREAMTPPVMNFVRWYGAGQLLNTLAGPKLANHAAGQPSNEDGLAKVKAVREFLNFATKRGWVEVGLSSHLKIKRTQSKFSASSVSRPVVVDKLVLTPEQKAGMETELNALKEKRINILEEIKRAAADKDLKENAPYHAAREDKAKLDGKIDELALLLKHAVVSTSGLKTKKNSRAELGRCVTIKEIATGSVSTFTLVIPREVNPKKGCISPASPIGKAITGCSVGDTVEVVAPSCVIRYFIESIN